MSSESLQRALLSLRGLACGDSFGESFFLPPAHARDLIATRSLPPPPWRFTEDTVMAIAIVKSLIADGEVRPEPLAGHFADLYDITRAFGSAMHAHLTDLAVFGPAHWERLSRGLFNGSGSFGNGSAMRVAPLGAFFADQPDRIIDQAVLSAIPTHSHPDASAGAIAVSLAAAAFWNSRHQPAPAPSDLLSRIAANTPDGPVQDAIRRAADLPADTSPAQAATLLGNGTLVSCLDTVPFSLWSAATCPDSYEDALWRTVSVLGDRDTTCAIVGGIVILRTGIDAIPPAWLARAEAPWHLLTEPGTETPTRPQPTRIIQ